MKILYYDCSTGISGDMNLGALLDLGIDSGMFLHELSKLQLDHEFQVIINKSTKMGISGTKVDVIITGHDHSHGHDHDHSHTHDGGQQRNIGQIEAIINASTLSPRIKELSIKIFMQVAVAEAKVHDKPISEVHFHEVGAIDSIVDIVGAAICLDLLQVDRIMASSIQVGGGFVKCAHGLIPVPAPATVEILRNIPLRAGLVQFETTTPTGAAVLATVVDEFTDTYHFVIEKTGYGLGTKDFEVPNVLRVFLGSESMEDKKGLNDSKGTGISTRQYILETNIDDMNPEIYGYVEDLLFEKGALDVYKTPIIMKKGRPAVMLSVLTDEYHETVIKEILFKETSSFGLRKIEVDKIMLEREFEQIQTKYGALSIKKAYYQGKVIKYKPEFEECKVLAIENHVTINEIYKEAASIMEDRINDHR